MVFRVVSGLCLSAMVGFDTTGEFTGLLDLGLLWRLEVRQGRKYILE